MKSYVKEGIATRIPATDLSSANKKRAPKLTLTRTKPMSENHRRGRATAIAKRTRQAFSDQFSEIIAPLFANMDGRFFFHFPENFSHDRSIEKSLIEGDLFFIPGYWYRAQELRNNPIEKRPSATFAKFRISPDDDIQALDVSDKSDFKFEIIVMQKLLNYMLELIESSLKINSFCRDDNHGMDAIFYGFKDAHAAIFSPHTLDVLNQVVKRCVKLKKQNHH